MPSFPFDQNIANSLNFLQWGFRVDRATATLPQSTTGHIFTVSGGRVIVNLILGEVTTIIQAQATTLKLTATPTTGTAVDMCATSDLTGLEVGGKLALPAAAASVLTKTNTGAIVAGNAAFVVAIGTIDLITVASSTGSIKWSCFWTPFDDGALLVAF